MAVREIKPGIYSVGAIDWDRRLFDELIPLTDEILKKHKKTDAVLVKEEAKNEFIQCN